MISFARSLTGVVLCGAVVAFASSLAAQTLETFTAEEPAPDDATASAISLSQVEAALAAIESDPALDDAAKGLLRPKYQQAIEALREAADFQSKASEYRDAIESAPQETATLRSDVRALPAADSDPDMDLPDNAEDLQREVQRQRE